MHNLAGQKRVICFFISLIFLSLLMTTQAQARAVDEIKIKPLADGYKIIVDFLFAIKYQSHAPNNPSKEFYIQLKTIDFATLNDQDIDSLRERLRWGEDPTTDIPLQEITFEGGDPERPQMAFIFTEEVECDIQSSGDLRSLIITVKTKKPPQAKLQEKEKPQEKAFEKKKAEISLPEKALTEDQALAKLMEDARDALIKGQYDVSIQIYTKILQTAVGPVKQQAQELLGVARERNNQFAHAKAEYQRYLNEFPKGPDADRVRQRLNALITAALEPKEKLKEAKGAARKERGKWTVQNYGTFSQFFFHDQTTPQGGKTRVNRKDLSSDLDFNSRRRSDDLDINARFTGGYQQDFVRDKRDQATISALSIDTRSKKNGWHAKLGRQTLSAGGVFGRFDGSHMSVKLNPLIKLNGVFGYPVESVRQTGVRTDKQFSGISFDFGTFRQKWDFSTYFVNQKNHSLTDRLAIGAETRYFDPKRSFFTLTDYDVFFNMLNIFLFNGYWTLPSKTTLNLILDYRKSPLLTLNNAIIGQGVTKIADLLSSFTERELKQLAKDRTADSRSLAFGITQDLRESLQLVTEFLVSELDGTVTSGGVEGEPGTGKEYTYSTQLISSNVFKENDVIISGLSYSDAAQNNTYSLNINARYPLTQKTRLVPRFRMDFRDSKNGSGNRFTLRPAMRVEYNFTKWMHFEIEGGIEWVDETIAGTKQQSTETFISTGYRASF